MPVAVVTGGAGFVGSHLCGRLLLDGFEVVAVDSMLTGDAANVSEFLDDPAFSLVGADVSQKLPVDGTVDVVAHLASPASPVDYAAHPFATLAAGSEGTRNALELARASDAVFLLASTSEVYGDPEVHPQPESYTGNVSPTGPRSVYDEAKRFAEAVTSAYARSAGVDVRIARIFNTYGPRMRRGDGRAVPTFVEQALCGRPLTVHGDGSQTRSLCFVDDLIDGIRRLLDSGVHEPVNLGNPEEVTVGELAERIRRIAGTDAPIELTDRPPDDPSRRRPDITRARTLLGWEPRVSVDEGLARTVAWARSVWRIG
jgi:dTDP-glucose 4,6-dehydratase